ncbi:unnamed protein product [Cylicocyclus nassatus]|uniref:PPM-type phosphatase domain-containing protein n=1 Tax=Cylicocyclus nassatus TaxID=53992 RepID=A0AA36GR74_CYLNA|nr:unnamed protein product [Cylicocyclus nassatus]
MAPNSTGAKKGASFPSMFLGENLRITVAANQGGRKYMEDRVHIETIRNEDGSIKFTFFGIFDGHGGHEASEYVRKNLLNNIMKSDLFDSDDDDDVLEAIRLGFLSTHHGIWKIVSEWPRTASGYPSTAGTTVSIAIVRKGKLFTGHVGDSAIILLKRSYLQDNSEDLVPHRLTVDHKPESEDEQARIRGAGGSVALKSGVARVVWTRPMKQHTGPIRRSTPTESIPFLAVARSLGDVWSYCEDTQEFIVSPEPDLAVREITGDDVCLVLASDGLTNVLGPVQVAAIVDEEENVSQIGVDRSEDLVYRDKHTNLARVLVANAIRNWRHLRADNVTAITVMFDSPYADLPVDHPCVEEFIGNKCSIDKVFVDDPECMVRVSPSTTLKLYTYRTPIVYKGARDPHFSVVEYTGPGFMTHTEERLLEERYCKAYQEAQQDDSSNKLELEFSTADCEKFDVNVVPTRTSGHHEEEAVTITSKMQTSSEVGSVDEDGTDEEEEKCSSNDANATTSPLGSDVRNEEGRNGRKKRVTRSLSRLSNMDSVTPSRITTGMTLRHTEGIVIKRGPCRSPCVKMEDKVLTPSGPVDIKIHVASSLTPTFGMITRSRERNATTLLVDVRTPTLRNGPKSDVTPQLRNIINDGGSLATPLTGSRKRSHRLIAESSGITPVVHRLSLDIPRRNSEEFDSSLTAVPGKVRSAPSTPSKATSSASRLGRRPDGEFGIRGATIQDAADIWLHATSCRIRYREWTVTSGRKLIGDFNSIAFKE